MLQIYINGLNDDLWKSDKKVSEQIDQSQRELFVTFYKEQLTNTKFSVSHKKNWDEYFTKQNKINEEKQKVLLDMYSNLKTEKIKSIREAYLKEVVEKEERPEQCYELVPDGKSGNTKLAMECSYCVFKQHCFPDMKVFAYSTGPRFLVDVVNYPKVAEVYNYFQKE